MRVQTFLPYPDFKRTARCLDDKRLGKQRSEARIILMALEGRTRGWKHHPAVSMWRGYRNALKRYMNAIIIEWTRRGFRNNMELATIRGRTVLPPWLGEERFHSAHRSNLLRKDPEFYGRYRWKEGPDQPYVWPE